jgi:hypothetical protein
MFDNNPLAANTGRGKIYEMRGLHVVIGDDRPLGPDALRCAKADLFNLVPGGKSRIQAMIKIWKSKLRPIVTMPLDRTSIVEVIS